MLLKDLLIRQSSNDKVAIRHGEKWITYAELFEKSVSIANILLEKTSPQKNIGIFLPNSIEYIICYFGITFANMIIVPVDINAKSREIIDVIARCDINVIITDSTGVQKLSEIDGLSIILISDNLLREYDFPLTEPAVNNDPNETVLILQTSGTTSTRKGVMLTHRNLLSNVCANIRTHAYSDDEKTLIIMPIYFSYCNTSQFLTHVYLGAEIVIYDKTPSDADILKAIACQEITNFNCVPATLLAIGKIKSMKEYNLKRLRTIFFGAGFMPTDKLNSIMNRFTGVEFIHTYGLTEAGPRVSSLFVNKDYSKLGSIGRPLEGVNVKISHGELLVSSTGITKGYYNDVKSTNELIRNGWLHTGDMAKIDNEGFIYLKGRKKNIINSGGMIIYPEEIETVLLNFPSVKKALVYADKHDILIEIPVAKVVLHESALIDNIIPELRKHCVRNLSGYKIPYKINIVDDLEETGSGKIKRKGAF